MLQSSPDNLIVLETDVRLAEEAFDNANHAPRGQAVLATGQRPNLFRQRDIGYKNVLDTAEYAIRARCLFRIVVEQVAKQNVGVDRDQTPTRPMRCATIPHR